MAIAADLVAPNPGYGHPLRPGYVLTPKGRLLAAPCRDVVAQAAPLAPDLAGRKWTLPVIAAVQGGCGSFSRIAAALDGITPRALARALDDLAEARIIERTIDGDRPARARYRIPPRATRLARAALDLAEAARS